MGRKSLFRHAPSYLSCPRLVRLEERTLPAINFPAFASKVQSSLVSVQAAMNSALDAGNKIIILDSQLDDLTATKSFVANIGTKIHDAISSLTAASQIQGTLASAFGTDLLQNAVAINGDNVSIDLKLHETSSVANASIAFGLGLPGIPFRNTQKGGIAIDLGFDYRLKFDYAGATNTIMLNPAKGDTGHELSISAGVSLDNNFAITAELGFVEVALKDASPGATHLDANFGLDGLTVNQPVFDVTGSATLNVAVDAVFALNFPSVGANLVGSWSIDIDSTNPQGGQAPQLSLNGVNVKLGDVLSNMMHPILSSRSLSRSRRHCIPYSNCCASRSPY